MNAILKPGLKFLKEVQSKVGFFNSGFTIAVFRGSGKMPVEGDILTIRTIQSSHTSESIKILVVKGSKGHVVMFIWDNIVLISGKVTGENLKIESSLAHTLC